MSKEIFRVNFSTDVLADIIVPRIEVPDDTKIVRIVEEPFVYENPTVYSVYPSRFCFIFSSETGGMGCANIPEGGMIPVVTPELYPVKKRS